MFLSAFGRTATPTQPNALSAIIRANLWLKVK